MSTREQRRAWQDFRQANGSTVEEFTRRWTHMFSKDPTPEALDSYNKTRTELRAPLGRKVKHPDITPTTVTRRYEWDMAHRLPQHAGKCSRLHGHRYVAEIDATGTLQLDGSSAGMVIDFGDLDLLIETCIGHWDHRTMLYIKDECLWVEAKSELYDTTLGVFRVPYIPTAENICHDIKRRLEAGRKDIKITRVRVYETPNGWAEVRS